MKEIGGSTAGMVSVQDTVQSMTGKMEELMKMKAEFEKIQVELQPLVNAGSGKLAALMQQTEQAADNENRLKKFNDDNNRMMQELEARIRSDQGNFMSQISKIDEHEKTIVNLRKELQIINNNYKQQQAALRLSQENLEAALGANVGEKTP